MGFLDTVSKAKAFDQAQSAQQEKNAVDAELLNALKAQDQVNSQAMRDEAIFKAGVEGGLAGAMAGPTALAADSHMAPPADVNVSNEEISMLHSLGIENPTMEDVMFLRKQASLEQLQGGLGAAPDTNTSGLAGQLSKGY